MKTKLLSLFAVLLITQGLMAQFHIGAKGGANIIKVEGKSFDQQFRYGYHAGGFAEIGLCGNLGIQPEVIFNQYSTRVDSNFNHVYQNVFNQGDVKLNYLSIPILLSYKLFGNFLSIQAGPQYSVMINKSKTLLENGSQAFKSGDFSMVGGVHLKIKSLRVDGRYVVGLNNINDIDEKEKWKSVGYQVSVGVAL